MSDFKSMRGGNMVEDLEFTAKILTSSHWPISDIPKCNIPRSLMKAKDQFTSFYKNKFANREI